jgi:hypothetical protein
LVFKKDSKKFQLVFKKDSQKLNCKMPMMINRYFSIYLTHILRYLNLLRISWQSLPHLYSRILPEGDPEAQGLRAGWGAIFDWLRTQDLGTQLGIIAGMVAVGYLTYRFFFSSDGGGPGGGGPGGDDDNDEGGANEPDHQEARRPEEIPLRDNRLDNQNIQPVNIALNNPPAGGLGINEAARYAAAATVGAGLSYMHDRAMNPDRANAQANPNPNQQQQHQPQADVEAEGQAVAEQPILHEAIMNPIIPRVYEQHPQAAEQPNIAAEAEVEVEVEGDEPILHEPIPQGEAIINPQGSIINAEEEGQAVAEQPPVDEQHPEAAEQANIAAEAEDEGEEPILHEPIPQGEAIINPQGDAEQPIEGQGDAEQPIEGQAVAEQPPVDEQHPEAAEQPISAAEAEVEVEDEGEEPILHEPIPQGEAIINPQGSIIHAEQVVAIAEQMVAIVQAEGEEPIIPAEQPIIADVEVDVQLDIVPEPIMNPIIAQPDPQGAIIPPQELPLHGQAQDIIYPQGQASAIFNGGVAQLGVIAAATIVGDVRQSTNDGRETPHRTPEAVPQPTTPSTGTTPQHSAEPIIGPRIESTNTGGKVTSTTNTLSKSAKRKLKEREKALAKAEAIALAKAEADAKKAEKGKSASTASRDLSLDPNNNNNQATSSTARLQDIGMDLNNNNNPDPATSASSRAKDPNNNNVDAASYKETLNTLKLKLQKIETTLAMYLDPKAGLNTPSMRVLNICKGYKVYLLTEPEHAEVILSTIKYIIIYFKINEELANQKSYNRDNGLLKFMRTIYNYPDAAVVTFINDFLDKVSHLTDAELEKILGKILAQVLHSTFPIRRG